MVYHHLNEIWKAKASPVWFKDKVIKLAPKIPGNTELNNMRPISLYEVIRKVWTTIIAKRIHKSWHDLHLLHPSQHGYRLDQGTLMALHTITNEIEEANHAKCPKHMTFWDIKRAFDSIPRNVQKLAWLRLGVPLTIAEWFVDLDDGGLSFIDTPHYQQKKSLRPVDDLKARPGHFSGEPNLAFQAQRGIGQGESASSLMWTALYDILLEWIDPNNLHLHQDEQLPYSSKDIIDNTGSTAYADDLATFAKGPNAHVMHQLTTTWLSAFCAFAGLVIHPAKVKSTLLGPIPDPVTRPTTLVVHDLAWRPIECAIDPHFLTVKYLGVQMDLRSRLRSHHHMKTKIDHALSHLIVQAGTPAVKIDYILFKLIPQVMATAVCANWSLAQYRALDKPLSQMYRIILGLTPKFPAALLYLPKSSMGIGLPRFSDKAQIMKWEALARSQAVGGPPASSVCDLFDRLPPETSTTTEFVRRLSPPSKWPQRRFLVRSLIEWWHESDLTLSQRLTDPVTQDINYSNNLSLQSLAQDLRLHPDYALYSEEDNQNLPLIRLACSDGSFTVRPRGHYDIITSQGLLNCIGTGAGGIVFLPPGYQEQTHRPNCVRIHNPSPLPGMNAYAWELVTQLITIKFTAYMPSHLVLTSDCTSAIARTNQALSTTNDLLVNTKGGIFASSVHRHACPFAPRKFIHTRGHPERSPDRTANPTIRDKAICIADAVASGTPAVLGQRSFPTARFDLKLTDILPELIPANQWHLRGRSSDFPVLGDVLEFQHATLLSTYTSLRDSASHDPTWSTTAYTFAHAIHPLKDRSYWTAARRTSTAFDWHSHGRNRAKQDHPTVAQATPPPEHCCRLCGAIDSQQHCMLDCPDQRIVRIRYAAGKKQSKAFAELCTPNLPSKFRHFAQQISHGSWTRSPNLSRIWLGMWNLDTLRTMIQPALTAPLTMDDRKRYIKIARKLTRPLIQAYSKMLTLIMKTPLRTSGSPASTVTRMPPLLRNALENTFPQDTTSAPPTNGAADLEHIAEIHYIDAYTISDAACFYEYVDSEL